MVWRPHTFGDTVYLARAVNLWSVLWSVHFPPQGEIRQGFPLLPFVFAVIMKPLLMFRGEIGICDAGNCESPCWPECVYAAAKIELSV